MNRANGFSWRPTTTIVLLGGFAVVLVAIVAAYMVSAFQPKTEVRINGMTYQVQVATTESARAQGLSGVRKLAPNAGLLMDYQEDGLWGIWMKNMHIPLDIIWIDKAGKVVYIVKNVPPEQSVDVIMRPKTKARYVLELNAGSVDRAGIRTGQILELLPGEVSK